MVIDEARSLQVSIDGSTAYPPKAFLSEVFADPVRQRCVRRHLVVILPVVDLGAPRYKLPYVLVETSVGILNV